MRFIHRAAAAVAAIVAIVAIVALDAGAADPAVVAQARARSEEVAAYLAPLERIYVAGKPARVRLSIANGGKSALSIGNAALFGAGLRATGADAVARTVPDSAAPSDARGTVTLPAGTSLSTSLDLAPLLPEVFAKRGRVKVEFEIAGVAPATLELEVHPDWTGWKVVIETDFGEMELELFPERAPVTVANFLDLVEKGFYDGLTFHRVVKGFMVQGGCPNGDGTGDGPRKLPLEAGRGPDALQHERGTISMAHKADPNSGSCQFFLCHRDQPSLNGSYAAFGRIVRGLETLDRIVEVPCAMVPGGPDKVPSRPREKVAITKMRLVAPGRPGAGG